MLGRQSRLLHPSRILTARVVYTLMHGLVNGFAAVHSGDVSASGGHPHLEHRNGGQRLRGVVSDATHVPINLIFFKLVSLASYVYCSSAALIYAK